MARLTKEQLDMLTELKDITDFTIKLTYPFIFLNTKQNVNASKQPIRLLHYVVNLRNMMITQ